MILFPYLFYEECESVLSTFSIPLYQKKEGELASYSRVRSLPSISAPLVVTYVEERFGTL